MYQGQAWSIVERSAQVELVNCRQDEGPETRPETHYQEVPTLLLRREGHPDLLVTSTPDDGVYQSYGARTSWVALVDHYLIFEEHTGGYSWGAHGNTSSELRVINLETGQLEDSLFTSDDTATLADARRQAFISVRDRSNGEVVHPDQLHPVSLRIDYSPPNPSVDVLLSASSCYACGDGRWGSYTISEPARAPAPSALLPSLRAPPLAIRQWLASRPVSLLGWSTQPSTNITSQETRRTNSAETGFIQ